MRADHSDALSVAATDATRTALRVACIHVALEAIAEQVRQGGTDADGARSPRGRRVESAAVVDRANRPGRVDPARAIDTP